MLVRFKRRQKIQKQTISTINKNFILYFMLIPAEKENKVVRNKFDHS